MPIVSKVQGNLLGLFENGLVDVIIHGANCQGVMGAGIAGQISSRYPDALGADHDYHIPVGSRLRGGRFSSYKSPCGGIIINAYTQFDLGADASYSLVGECFRNINDALNLVNLSDNHNVLVGIPAIGCGIGGLEWEVVEDIINEMTPDIDLVFVGYDG